MTTRQIHFASVIIAIAAILAACGGGTSKATPTPHPPTPTPKPVATSTAEAVPLPPTNTPEIVSTSTPSPVVDPCALVTSVEGVERGASFALNVNVKWQLCLGGVSGSAKYLFRTNDAEASWKLISRTTVPVDQPPQAGVGQLPDANYPKQILFLDETHGWIGIGWMGMNTQPGGGPTLWRSQDGGVTWASVSAIPPGVPVTSITFTDSQHGTVVTPEGNWTTSDGGVTWTH
jgi:hypothetical protein